jgi:hypothetical protein
VFPITDLKSITGQNVQAGFYYGSRTGAYHRENSDWDASFIVESKNEFTKELHGRVTIEGRIYNIEFRLFDKNIFEKELESDFLLKLEIAHAKLAGFSAYEKTLQNKAIILLGKECDDMRKEIYEDNIVEKKHLLKVAFAEGWWVLEDPRLQNNRLAYLTRLTDYIFLYFLHAQKLYIEKYPNECDDAVLHSLLLMEGYRSFRIFDYNKHKVTLKFQILINKLNKCLVAASNQNLIHKEVFSILNAHYKGIFQDNLLDKHKLIPEVFI